MMLGVIRNEAVHQAGRGRDGPFGRNVNLGHRRTLPASKPDAVAGRATPHGVSLCYTRILSLCGSEAGVSLLMCPGTYSSRPGLLGVGCVLCLSTSQSLRAG